MDILGKTLATIGAAWICLLATIVLFDYLQNARDLLNLTSVEFKNSNYTGAEELANTAYLDNFEHVEHELEEKGSPSFMEDLEHMMREELRDLIQDKVDQTELDMHINATDAKLVEAIDLLKGTE